MELEKQTIWFIPGETQEENSLYDGQLEVYKSKLGDRGHIKNCQDFCESHNLALPSTKSHDGYGKMFASQNIIVFFNSSVCIDGKHYGAMYLPEQLSSNQIEFLESQKILFFEQYNSNILEFVFYTTQVLDYTSSKKGFRDLRIENIIAGGPKMNNIELFYAELERQKERLHTK